MTKAIIIDDEPAAGEVIQTLIETFTDDVGVCAVCLNINDAIASINKYRPDILFLDIELADGSGFEVLENFPELQTRVIFVTAYEQYALKAIKYHAFDYILKPIVPEEFKGVLNKVLTDIKKTSPFPDSLALLQYLKGSTVQKIAVPIRNGLHYYLVDDIILLEGEGSYTNIYLTDNTPVLVSKILKDFETSLVGNGFLRVHKSFLVNMRHVVEFRKEDNGCVVMSNGKTVPIGAKHKEDIINQLKSSAHLV